MQKQTTLRSEISISGKGLHSGQMVTVTLQPAEADTGITFRRSDLPGTPLVHANVKNVFDTSRGTSLQENGVEVRTIEHLMAALAGLQVDNVLVEMNASETPILDGSSQLYVAAIQQAGLQELEAERHYIEVKEEVQFSKPNSGITIRLLPADSFQVEVEVDYNSQVLPAQTARLDDIRDFAADFAKCRTFVFLHEIQFLIENGLVKGGDLDNAIVFVEKQPEPEVLEKLSKFFNKQDITVTETGILNTLKLQFPNEPARHKLLDLVGDLYLLGKPLKGKVIAKRPGHFANTEFGKHIAEMCDC